MVREVFSEELIFEQRHHEVEEQAMQLSESFFEPKNQECKGPVVKCAWKLRVTTKKGRDWDPISKQE